MADDKIIPPFVRVYVDLPRDAHNQLVDMAKAAGMSQKAYMTNLIIESAAKLKRGKK
jgi:hypothetical protein